MFRMVETLDEAKRRGKRDIPPFGKIKEINYAPEWKKKFNYPINEIQIADYYVEYNIAKKFAPKWLIEASSSNLHTQKLQLEASAQFFKENKIEVDGYLVVLDDLTKRDKQKYKLREGVSKPLKQVYERIGYNNEKECKLYGKPIFVLFREDFKRLRK